MTPSPDEQPPAGRQPYEKPVLRSISLVADQVLGVGCKNDSGPLTDFGNAVGCLDNPCYADGS